MKIDSQKGTDTPVLTLEATDSQGIRDLTQLLAGKAMCSHCGKENDNFAWKSLMGYVGNLRRWVEELGKSHAQSETKKDVCSNDFSILTGIDMAIGLPEKLIAKFDHMARVEEHRITQEADDARGNEFNTD